MAAGRVATPASWSTDNNKLTYAVTTACCGGQVREVAIFLSEWDNYLIHSLIVVVSVNECHNNIILQFNLSTLLIKTRNQTLKQNSTTFLLHHLRPVLHTHSYLADLLTARVGLS